MTHSPGALFDRIVDIMRQLRGPTGCPWDREQTRTSLKPYLIEETYEVVEAIESGRPEALREELGDLLLQVVFHAQVATEQGEFDVTAVLQKLITKLLTRHPHVFGGAAAGSPREALAHWEAIKQREAEAAGQPRSVIDGVPRALPSLLRAQRTQDKAARIRFDWPDARAAWTKVEEEVREAGAAIADGAPRRVQEELGDVLFSVVNVARLSGVDAEEALQGAIEKFRRRFAGMEDVLTAQGKSIGNASQAELEQSWEAVKAQERPQ